MNSLGLALVWCALQVTVFGGAATLLYLLMRRLSPSARSTALTWSLVSVILLSLMAWSPWPRWIDDEAQTASQNRSNSPAGAAVDNSESSEPVVENAGDSTFVEGESASILFLRNLWDEMQHSDSPSAAATSEGLVWNWQRIVATIFLIGVGIGVLRLVTGLWSVHRYRQRSAPIEHAELHELLDIVRAELSCTRPIEVRESYAASSPATIGWRRPLILLPPEWREWTDIERHAVLAHEVAHIRRFDFPAWVVAQLGVVLHFYHPLVHWLAGRLRLEQELAADATAAAVTGGNSAYLQTLAGMALRQPERPLSWPARTFLPSHHTFMRRIEMLRQRHSLTARAPMVGRVVVTVCLLSAAIFAAGLRSPFESTPTVAAPPSVATESNSGGTLAADSDMMNLNYVPRDALIVVAARPQLALTQPALAPILKEFQNQKGFRETLGFSAHEDLQQVTAVFLPTEERGMVTPDQPGAILQFTKDIDQDALLKVMIPKPIAAEFGGQKYYKSEAVRGICVWFAGPRVVVTTDKEEQLRRFMVAGERGATKAGWADAWNQAADKHVAVYFDFERVRESFNAQMQRGPGAIALAPVSPLWDQGRFLTQSISFADGIKFEATVTCNDAKGATTLEQTINAIVILARNSLSQMRAQFSRDNSEQTLIALQAVDLADETLDSLKVKVEGDRVIASATIDSSAQQYIALLLPAIQQSRVAARRSQSMNNLKQIALAFHNYADVNGHFPPAVLMGPDGKTPHSWRVAILPYLEQQALYQQYKFDEPWDSENNKKIAEALIPIYRCPQDEGDSTNTSYFAVVGKGTVFDNPKGTPFREIMDGTSNTLMIVESKKAVPWTKPEDIAIELDKDLPAFGGWYDDGFIASICDGSVRFISKSIDPKTLKALLTKAGGEVIPSP